MQLAVWGRFRGTPWAYQKKSCLMFRDTLKGSLLVHLAVHSIALLGWCHIGACLVETKTVRPRRCLTDSTWCCQEVGRVSFACPQSAARPFGIDGAVRHLVHWHHVRLLTRYANVEQAMQAKWTGPDHLVRWTRRISTERSGAHINWNCLEPRVCVGCRCSAEAAERGVFKKSRITVQESP
jgi:hypothetical protein